MAFRVSELQIVPQQSNVYDSAYKTHSMTRRWKGSCLDLEGEVDVQKSGTVNSLNLRGPSLGEYLEL